ncbi:MAG: DNA polymerase ligase N-terminal domain-containing protein [Acidimicrobiia bacterium]|nr:DNA polymerase ligase N-terminal domain-containing protein [Acidimicrobiia bacterium]
MADLDEYEGKRDLDATPEPGADGGDTGGRRFVVQEHDASSHHYDVRIEADGVLKSWAVPKGPSTDPSEQRLAIPTEDHPLGYADFEGVIPEDEYGGGTVSVWDRGTYENATTDDDGDEIPVAEAIESGHVVVRLDGEKLSGGYAFTRTGDDDDARWLLVKTDDDEADARRNPTSTEPESVVSGRTIEEIAEDESGDG